MKCKECGEFFAVDITKIFKITAFIYTGKNIMKIDSLRFDLNKNTINLDELSCNNCGASFLDNAMIRCFNCGNYIEFNNLYEHNSDLLCENCVKDKEDYIKLIDVFKELEVK